MPVNLQQITLLTVGLEGNRLHLTGTIHARGGNKGITGGLHCLEVDECGIGGLLVHNDVGIAHRQGHIGDSYEFRAADDRIDRRPFAQHITLRIKTRRFLPKQGKRKIHVGKAQTDRVARQRTVALISAVDARKGIDIITANGQ